MHMGRSLLGMFTLVMSMVPKFIITARSIGGAWHVLVACNTNFVMRENKFSSQQQKLGDIVEMTFGGRYVIVMMAFSIYTGLLYNEFFSVPFELFGPSAYACRDPSCRH